jgi:hypothetical protein
MVPTHHAGKFLRKTKGFFPHDFTLIASVLRESVIGHGIGGKHIPTKMARLAKRPDAGVSDDGLVCHHPDLTATQTSDGSKIQVRRCHVP